MADLFRSGVLLMQRWVVVEEFSDFGDFSPPEGLRAAEPPPAASGGVAASAPPSCELRTSFREDAFIEGMGARGPRARDRAGAVRYNTAEPERQRSLPCAESLDTPGRVPSRTSSSRATWEELLPSACPLSSSKRLSPSEEYAWLLPV